jgi:hypothetical protein
LWRAGAQIHKRRERIDIDERLQRTHRIGVRVAAQRNRQRRGQPFQPVRPAAPPGSQEAAGGSNGALKFAGHRCARQLR